MPLYMDIHKVDGASVEDVAKAHVLDLQIQSQYEVEYLKYWFNHQCGKLFCLVEAPSAEAARCVHERAHGMVAEKLIEVDPDLVDSIMGEAPINADGAVLMPGLASQRDAGIRTILFTDIVNSTRWTSMHGDEAGMAMLSVHDRCVRKSVAAHGGREVKHTGDGIMAAFVSAASAVRCACQAQQGLQQHNRDFETEIQVRIGINAGEPVEKSNDLFGSTVQLAARLCAQAEPGQILVSSVVVDLCLGKGIKFAGAGDCVLKGFEKPIQTHLVEVQC